MNCIEETFSAFYEALGEAADNERSILDFVVAHLKCNKGYKARRLLEVAVAELKEYFERLIEVLNLRNPFLFLGRDIRSFNDAAYVVDNLQPLIAAQLHSCSIELTKDLICNITACCLELESSLAPLPMSYSH